MNANDSELARILTTPKISTNIRTMIPRLLENIVYDKLINYDKVILILGARQVGKTTIIKSLLEKLTKEGKKVLYLNCDIEENKKPLETTSLTLLGNLTRETDFLFIDEAQRLENPGLTIKIIHDNLKKVKVLATGSSAFELKNKLSDALTGRYLDFYLSPFSLTEVLKSLSLPNNKSLIKSTADSILNQILIYGFYPEVYLAQKEEDRKLFLQKITESYLFKDILSFRSIRNPKAIVDLTKALAYQIGSEVSENELANRVKIDRKTVVSYLDILEKSFVIIRIYPFSQNPRREIGRNYKVYFSDVGLRNALIGDFNPIEIRQDGGYLWENFLFVERLKRYSNVGQKTGYNFWRSYGGAEVDYLERNGSLKAFEFKLTGGSLSRGAKIFAKNYKTAVEIVNKENYLDFLT